MLVHAVGPAEAADPPTGLRGMPLQRVQRGALVAWVSSIEQLEQNDLLEHHALLERIHALSRACIPVRFPTWLSREEIVSALDARQSELCAVLNEVRGRTEIALTVLGGSEPRPATGTAYLHARQRRRQQIGELQQAIEGALGLDLIRARHTPQPRAGVLLSSALLVPSDRAADLIARLQAFEWDGIRILVVGPWPPYSFAGPM